MAQTQKKQQDMGTGDVKKLLLQLMIPAVVAQVGEHDAVRVCSQDLFCC